jgi:hypothetical protein
MQNTVKKYLLFFMLAMVCLPFATQAQSTPNEFGQRALQYKETGPESQIKKFLCAPTDASKDGGDTDGTAAANNSASGDLYTCINKLYRFALVFGSVTAVFFIVIAGWVYMSAEGNNESVEKAKSILVSSIAGLVILFSGYVLLKAINPQLVQFQTIQPPSVKLDTTNWNDWATKTDTSGKVISVTSNNVTYNALGNNDAKQIEDAGCTFQLAKLKTEIVGIQPELFVAVVNMCKAGSAKGKIQISSIASGKHAPNSYHYKFCAVDFADGSGNFRNTPAGKAAEAAATGLRINPGTDANEYNHLHVDLSTRCKN